MKRLAIAMPIAGVLTGLFAGTAALVPAAQPCAAATYSSHVTLVAEHGDTRVIGLCIGFDGPSITGEQILQASGLEYATQSYGSLGDAVCQLDSEPASYGACLPASGSFWAMFVSRGGGDWQNADHGISTENFADGDAEGFRYDSQSGPEPPPASPAGICTRALSGSATSAPAAAGVSGGAGAAPRAPGSAAGTAPGGSGESGASASSGSGASPPAAAAGAAAGSPAPAVIRPPGNTGAVAAAGARKTRSGSGPDPVLLAAAAAGGALAGLVIVRVVRRRTVGSV